MGRTTKTEDLILSWKELQVKHADDEEFFHYSQKNIDLLEDELDKQRMEKDYGVI